MNKRANVEKIKNGQNTIKGKDRISAMRLITFIKSVATIRNKLIASFLVPIAFIIVLGAVSFGLAEKGIRNSYEKSTLEAINMTSEYLRFGVDSMESVAIQYMNDDTMRNYVSGYYKKDILKNSDAYLKLMDAVMVKEVADKFISDITVFSMDVDAITTIPYLQKDLFIRFLDTQIGQSIATSSDTVWVGSDAFLDQETRINNESYSLRLFRRIEKANALIMIDMDTETVQDILNRLQFENTGTLGFVTSDGKEVLNNDQGDEVKAIFSDKAFYQEALNSEITSKATYVDYEGKDHLFIYSKIGNTGAMICAIVPRSTILSQADSIKRVTVFIVILACLIAVLTSVFISSGIEKVIKNIIHKLKKAAQGDLTVDFSTKRTDEFRVLIDEINHTFTNMKELIGQVKDMSGVVSEASNDVTKTSEVFLNTARNISSAMEEIEQGIMQQAKDAEECLIQMDNLSNKIVRMSDETDQISRIAAGTKKSIENGTVVTKELTNQTKSTIEISTDIIRGIEDLEEKSNYIGTIINTINEISNQTNLLSLNASIEAARAGQYGKGFAVVASEIRNLADQTKRSVHDIQKIIETIQNDTRNLVLTAKSAETVMALQDNAVQNTNASYMDINNSVDDLMINLNNITEYVGNIETARASTLNAIENISAVLEEIAASTNSVNQISTDQLQSVETLNQSAGCLNNNSDQLVNAVLKFTV